MKEITHNITECSDCPFCRHQNMGQWSATFCTNKQSPSGYDSMLTDVHSNSVPDGSPKWCPLDKEGLTIKYVKTVPGGGIND